MTKTKSALVCGALTLTVFALAGCGPKIMRETNTWHTASQEYALVTFLRPTGFGGAIDFGIWDGDRFVGNIDPHRMIQHKAAPGEHLFLARAENWSYLKATLEGSKQYYVIAAVFPGVWKARVALKPVVKGGDANQEKINEWVADARPSEVIPELFDQHQAERQPQVREAMAIYERGEAKFEVLEVTDTWQ